MSDIRWHRVNNSEQMEYAIQRSTHGDEFVKLLDGSCLRRPPTEKLIEQIRDLLGVIKAVRGEDSIILRTSGKRGEAQDVGVIGLNIFNDLMKRVLAALQ